MKSLLTHASAFLFLALFAFFIISGCSPKDKKDTAAQDQEEIVPAPVDEQDAATSGTDTVPALIDEVDEDEEIENEAEAHDDADQTEITDDRPVRPATITPVPVTVEVEEAAPPVQPVISIPTKEEEVPGVTNPVQVVEEATAEVEEVVEEIEVIEPEAEPEPEPESEPMTNASDWFVPADYRNMTNPVESDASSRNFGKSLYKLHCASCHGKYGYGDGSKAAQLDTPAGDFSLSSFQDQTDGSLFYKTWEGRDEMPRFKKKIPDDEDIWHIINFIRSFRE